MDCTKRSHHRDSLEHVASHTEETVFTLKFSTDNKIFQSPNRNQEIAGILRGISEAFRDHYPGYTEGKVIDLNGNSIGTWKLTKR